MHVIGLGANQQQPLRKGRQYRQLVSQPTRHPLAGTSSSQIHNQSCDIPVVLGTSTCTCHSIAAESAGAIL
jgi:hypothetical protein